MASEKLEIIITVADQTKGALGGIHGNIQKIGKVALGVGAAGVTALAGGLALLGKEAIMAGSDAEEMLGKFNVVFAETGGQVTDQLNEFADSVGRSRFELLGMASTFGDTLKPMGFSEQAAADYSVQLSKLAVDLGSFNNMETDEALQRLQGTLIGSHENALAFGVIINENTLSAKLAAEGWDDLTGVQLEQAKVQARMMLLMEGTTDAQGDALRTSASWANQMRGLQATMKDTAAEIGLKLLPILTPLLERLGEMAKDILPVVLSVITEVTNRIGLFTSMLDMGMSPLDAFIGAMSGLIPQETLEKIRGFVNVTLPSIIQKFNEIIAPIVAFVQQWVSMQDVMIALGIAVAAVVIPALISIATTMAPILIAAGLLVAAVSAMRAAWEADLFGIRTAVTEWAEENGGVMQGIQNWWLRLQVTWSQLAFIVGVGVEIIKAWWADLTTTWEQVTFLIGVGVDVVKAWWTDLQVTTDQIFMLIGIGLFKLGAKWIDFRDQMKAIVNSIKGIWQGLRSVFSSVSSGIMSAIQPIINAINDMKFALSNIELPDWMTPGSPTPWENGLKGVNNAMQQLNSVSLPALTSQLTSSDAAVVSNTTNNNMVWNVQTSALNTDSEARAGLAFNGGI